MKDAPRLFAASFLMLVVELVLIRWLGANIVYLSYFSNFVLLGSFLGIGLGFIRGGGGDWFRWAPVLLTTLVVFAVAFPVSIDRSGSGLIFFGGASTSGPPIWVVLPLVFAAVAATMASIAQGVAGFFEPFDALDAYRLDVLGSVAGIAVFALLSLIGAPPLTWGLLIAGLFGFIWWPKISLTQVAALVGLVAIFAVFLFIPGVRWSPYYLISWQRVNEDITLVSVNRIPHQEMTTIAVRRSQEPTYFLPYERAVGNPLDHVLVVGAGTGTDVAIALSEDADHVDAVEIDPQLYRLGRDLNPEQPYEDPRVEVFIDDARAFLQRTDRTYDLILFALPDSLTLVAGQSSLRLESYLFTREAMEQAKRHLAPGGVFAMYNYYREAWLADRLANTLREVYGHNPCFDSTRQVGYLALLTASQDPSAVSCPHPWQPVAHPVVAPATDDRPFVYLRTRSIPEFYLFALAMIIAFSAIAVRRVSGGFGPLRAYADLFFLGAAFLLLETKSVVQFALLFGTTWFVNALVFAGILLTVLLAIEVARRMRPPRLGLVYAALGVGLAIAYSVPTSALLGLSIGPRFFAATALAFAPVFFANLLFAERFHQVDRPTAAFGANLLGAMVGGALEYTSLVIGYRALLLVAAGLYLLALLTGREHIHVGAQAS